MRLLNTYPYRMLPLFSGVMALFVTIVLLAACATVNREAAMQKSFDSPQEAVVALVKAVQDDNDGELLSILGPGSEDLTSSGDKVADQNSRSRFLKAYEKKNSIVPETEDRAIFFVGEKDYPFPIPLVRQGRGWVFDTKEGKEEILNRRIGRNELHTIDVMQAYTDAQREYVCMQRTGEGGPPEFAQKLASSEGMRDGLYWDVTEGEEESPLGPLMVRASEEGYEGGLDKEPPEPFHGYYFKILTAQGAHATGGAFDYVVDGKMILGFGLVAYPAKYGVSGIMTFIINQEDVIYEKDLGENTATVAATMTTFDPDDTWHRYEESAER